MSWKKRWEWRGRTPREGGGEKRARGPQEVSTRQQVWPSVEGGAGYAAMEDRRTNSACLDKNQRIQQDLEETMSPLRSQEATNLCASSTQHHAEKGLLSCWSDASPGVDVYKEVGPKMKRG